MYILHEGRFLVLFDSNSKRLIWKVNLTLLCTMFLMTVPSVDTCGVALKEQ